MAYQYRCLALGSSLQGGVGVVYIPFRVLCPDELRVEAITYSHLGFNIRTRANSTSQVWGMVPY